VYEPGRPLDVLTSNVAQPLRVSVVGQAVAHLQFAKSRVQDEETARGQKHLVHDHVACRVSRGGHQGTTVALARLLDYCRLSLGHVVIAM